MDNDRTLEYRRTVAREWNRAAVGWHAWVPFVRSWLAEPTARMLDRAAIGSGSRVLDVAAGDGDQSIDAARRAGPDGVVVAIDTAAEMLQFAEESARALGLRIETQVMNAESLLYADASFDAAISRLGIMFCAAPAVAFGELCRVVVPGGRVSVIVFATAEQNPLFSIPVSVIRRRLGSPPAPPGTPGPFALGSNGVLRQAMETAGLTDVTVEEIEAPVRMSSAAECVRFRREASGTLAAMMATMDEAAKEATWAEMHDALSAFETGGEFISPCTVLVGSGAARIVRGLLQREGYAAKSTSRATRPLKRQCSRSTPQCCWSKRRSGAEAQPNAQCEEVRDAMDDLVRS